MSKTAKIVIIGTFLFLVYFVSSTITRENARKADISGIHDYFKKDFKIEDELKDQYDHNFIVKVGNETYEVVLKKNKVVSAKKVADENRKE
ncbi:hypothetical protein WD019_09085 [Fictibacillus sp. Mic-4]|uniref:hypothetical protein n=1 Tax=Fictibacillus sp. Mic-4 TaxID=3132826 RepID=UPI003CEA4089